MTIVDHHCLNFVFDIFFLSQLQTITHMTFHHKVEVIKFNYKYTLHLSRSSRPGAIVQGSNFQE